MDSFQGNAHVVYNGYFFYFRRDEPKIVKYDLTLDKQAGKLRQTLLLVMAFNIQLSDDLFPPMKAWKSSTMQRPIARTISTQLNTIWWISMWMIMDCGWFIQRHIPIIQSLLCWIQRRLKQFTVSTSASIITRYTWIINVAKQHKIISHTFSFSHLFLSGWRDVHRLWSSLRNRFNHRAKHKN